MKNKIEYHIPLILTVLMAVLIKIPYFGLPFCYSEAQLYTDSVFALKSGGTWTIFSDGSVLLPGLFDVIMAGFAGFVSSQIVYIHLFTLIFAVLTVVFVYKFGKFFFSIYAGVMSASLVLAQNIFLAQTGLMLPAMMLTCLIITALYFYFREKFIFSAVLLSLAALTDVLGVLTSCFVLAAYYKEKSNRDWRLSTNILLCLPIVLWFAYQIMSVTVCGRLSVRNFDFNIVNLLENLDFTFVSQYRFVLTAGFVAAVLITKFSKQTDFYAGDIFKTASVYFVVIFVLGSLFGCGKSYNLLTVTILAIATGCAISVLNLNSCYKYLITCALIVAFALNAAFEEDCSDVYLSFKDKVETDEKTVNILMQKAVKNEEILCDEYFKRFLEHSALGYIQHSYDVSDNHQITTEFSKNRPIVAVTTNFPLAKPLPVKIGEEGVINLCKISKNSYQTNILVLKK